MVRSSGDQAARQPQITRPTLYSKKHKVASGTLQMIPD